MVEAQEVAAASIVFPLPRSATVSRDSMVEECARSSGRGMMDFQRRRRDAGDGSGVESGDAEQSGQISRRLGGIREAGVKTVLSTISHQSLTVDMFGGTRQRR